MKESQTIAASQKFPMRPVAPLGVIAMRGCEEMGRRVNEYLMIWLVDSSTAEELHRLYGGRALRRPLAHLCGGQR